MKTLLTLLLAMTTVLSLQAAPGGVKGPNPEKASPVAIEAFLKHHPELREKLAKMTPEERRKFVEEHQDKKDDDKKDDDKKPSDKPGKGKKA